MFESIFPTAKGKLFQQHMIKFVNILELNDQKHQTNITLIDEIFKVVVLFTTKCFFSFGTYRQSMFDMSNMFL